MDANKSARGRADSTGGKGERDRREKKRKGGKGSVNSVFRARDCW